MSIFERIIIHSFHILLLKQFFIPSPHTHTHIHTGSIYRRGARRWRKLYRVNGHIFQAKRFNRVSIANALHSCFAIPIFPSLHFASFISIRLIHFSHSSVSHSRFSVHFRDDKIRELSVVSVQLMTNERKKKSLKEIRRRGK